MKTEVRWLPVITKGSSELYLGPACRDLKDAQDWCAWDLTGPDRGENVELDWTEPDAEPGMPSSIGPLPWVADIDGVYCEVTPIEVEV